MIEPQTIIDARYEVISRIGSGGMADVYLAEDKLLGRKVAVKVLHHRFAEDQEFVERFRREASSAASLSHPNVVAIFDRGEWNGTYYIAMEYLSGRSLKSLVSEHGALDPALATDIVIQILQAARFAHRQGIIHRDIKPHNVILDQEGRAKVTDFGIARAGASDMTLTGSIMGTAQYLSPEQAQGHPVSAASDVYAIGIVLYELLTGRIPFDGETAVSIALKQISAEPPAPSSINPGVPPALDAIVARALAKNPRDRFTGAEEFIAALEQARDQGFQGPHQTHVLSAAPPPDPATQASDGVLVSSYGKRRRRGLIIAAAVLLAALAAAALLLFTGAGHVRVPNVVGASRAAADARIREAGLVPSFTQNASSTVASGLVISTSPQPASTVRRGSVVHAVLSTGPGSAAVPDVTKLRRAVALGRLSQDGFAPNAQTQTSPTVKSGIVISTEPRAGTVVQLGSQVTVLVSGGPAKVSVPSLVGQTQQAAEAQLSSASLKVGAITREPTSDKPPGTVLSQSPEGGALVVTGSAVDLKVAQAPKELAVPDVLGQEEAAASAALSAAGFKAKTTTTPVNASSQVGLVVEQNPRAGQQARRGSTVTLVLGVAEQQPTTSTSTTTTTPTTTAPGPTPPPGQ